MNKVILAGRLTKDPEGRMGASGTEVSRFSLAVQGDFYNKETKERDVEFVNCVAFGQTAGVINKYAIKGTFITAVGRIKNGSYENKEGVKVYTTDVIVDNFQFVTGGRSKEEVTTNEVVIEKNNVEDPYSDFGEEISLSGDDLPF